MSESKQQWTPGPWELEVNGWDNQVVYGNDPRVSGKRRFIAEVSLYHDGANANAKLIAAAPELVEALRRTLQLLTDMGAPEEPEDAKVLEAARAALAKAGA
ncbi:hypothetical protein [Burkholderia gladioli]|uniref:hypothetical protein n=1 Tax=Burkholderia gladioli TaxID=28095 RepID=UPI00163FD66E|nr:hypothetical protein [Burkholderia gladioli]